MLSLCVPLPRDLLAFYALEKHKPPLSTTAPRAPGHMAKPAADKGGRLRKAPSLDGSSQLTLHTVYASSLSLTQPVHKCMDLIASHCERSVR